VVDGDASLQGRGWAADGAAAGDMMTFVLVHSPVVGPRTWAGVRNALRARGHGAIVPDARPPNDQADWSWSDFVDSVVEPLEIEGEMALVGHSAAGLLLPVIAERKAPRVRCCVFVDASIPAPEGRSPLVSAEFLQALEAMAKDGRVPRWSEWWPEEAMRAFVPDEDLRRQISEETPCLPLACFRDSVPVPAGWTNMPCGYLQFSDRYQSPADEARARGWRIARLDGDHLHMVVDPDATADALIEIVSRLG
jgi:pimeloyl-ACP methyl ester carboxylesterase